MSEEVQRGVEEALRAAGGALSMDDLVTRVQASTGASAFEVKGTVFTLVPDQVVLTRDLEIKLRDH
jgi:hypothetical protein